MCSTVMRHLRGAADHIVSSAQSQAGQGRKTSRNRRTQRLTEKRTFGEENSQCGPLFHEISRAAGPPRQTTKGDGLPHKVNNIWLKRAVVGAAVILFCTARLGAQADTMVFARMAGWNAPTFHFLDAVQTRGRLVLPDIGYVDFGRSNYRELYGGGLVVYPGKHFSWIQKCYFVRSLRRVANGASYLQPWTFVAYSIPQTRFLGETLYFTYLPLNRAGRIQYVLDRAKLERDYRRFKVGGRLCRIPIRADIVAEQAIRHGNHQGGRIGISGILAATIAGKLSAVSVALRSPFPPRTRRPLVVFDYCSPAYAPVSLDNRLEEEL